MNKTHFSVDQVKADIKALVNEQGITIHRLSQESGVDGKILRRFLSEDKSSVSALTLEKLWPYVYGDKRPVADNK